MVSEIGVKTAGLNPLNWISVHNFFKSLIIVVVQEIYVAQFTSDFENIFSNIGGFEFDS